MSAKRTGAALAVTVIAIVLLLASGTVAEAQSVAGAKSKALTYFHKAQTSGGGFGASGERASVTPWVVQAIAAAGKDAAAFRKSGGKSPITYLQSLDIKRQALSGTGSTRNPAAFYAKMIVTYRSARETALITKAGKKRINLVTSLLAYRSNQNGSFTTELNGQGSYASVSTTAWAVIALKAAGKSKSQLAKSVTWLRKRQLSSGGFSYTPGGSPDTDSTAAVVQALRAGGVSSTASSIKRALAYLRSQQSSNGGFTSGMTSTTNAESTAWAIMAIRSANQNPNGASWKRGGKSPISFLLSLQSSSGAFYHYGKTLAMPLLTSSQAVVALSGKKYPF
ncbi:MAG: prenyltransferase/squalene oxidase repeat-containing protein [Thermoleophilia bacterium]